MFFLYSFKILSFVASYLEEVTMSFTMEHSLEYTNEQMPMFLILTFWILVLAHLGSWPLGFVKLCFLRAQLLWMKLLLLLFRSFSVLL